MTVDFHKDMGKYISGRRFKRRFSNFRNNLMNKKAVVSYKAQNRFGKLKGQLKSRIDEIKKKKGKPENEITQESVDELVERKGVKREIKEKGEIEIPQKKGSGWKEVPIDDLKEEKRSMSDLEERKRKIQEELGEIHAKEKAEEEKLAKLSEENEQRGQEESESSKLERQELEEEIDVLKEKQKIEESRLDDLRKSRRKEQIEALQGKVMNILFKKRPKKEKDMAEEVRKEIRIDAKVDEAKRRKVEIKEAGKREEPMEKKAEEEKPEVKEEKKPKKSFLSKLIQVRTAAQIAKEEAEKLKQEEEKALKDQVKINNMLGHGGGEVVSNAPPEGQNANMLATLFPGGAKANVVEEQQTANLFTLFPGDTQQMQENVKNSEDMIELDQGYKIKVVKNQ